MTKFSLFFGGILVGAALGLMAGGALVEIPESGGERKYPVFPAMLLGIVGMISSGIGYRGLWPSRQSPRQP